MRFFLPLLLLCADAHADRDQWKTFTSPARGAAASIGGYSRGCVRGAVSLADTGPYHQLARPSRGRNYGHPLLVDFVKDLGAKLAKDGHRPLMVGDLGQPRGGPAPGGHASHQSGLDADIWFWAPKRAGKMKAAVRESTGAKDLVPQTGQVNKLFGKRTIAQLRHAALDARVARIFVNPAIKQALCRSYQQPPAWLRKVRPWYAHKAHFHVRLACPKDSPSCEPQAPLPDGHGCEGLAWWFDEKAQAARAKNRKRYRKKIAEPPPLPDACVSVAAAK